MGHVLRSSISNSNVSRPQGRTWDHPQTLVQCPNCYTKFSVESSVIAEIEDPRFHCSRCDSLFSLPKENLKIEEPIKPEIIDSDPSEPISSSDFSLGDITPKIEKPSTRELPAKPDLLVENSAVSQWTLGRDLITTPPDLTKAVATQTKLNITERNKSSVRSGMTLPRLSLSPNTRWSQPIALVLPMLALVVGLMFFSYSLTLSPNLSSWITNFASSSDIPSLPPSQLLVREPQIRPVKLQSGENISVIAGNVVNDSSTSVTNVEIEALLFDKTGVLVDSIRAPLRSALSREKVDQLSLDTVRRFQNSLAGKKIDLAPGEGANFTIAMINDRSSFNANAGDPVYFSARVYSVR